MRLPRPWSRPGPFAAYRDGYVGAYAGVSYDLAPGAVGVSPEFLRHAPDLPGKVVTVTHDGHAPKRPAFLVVELTRMMRDALSNAAEGGVVFSSFDLDDPERAGLVRALDVGDAVYMNATLSRLPAAAVRRPFSAS